MIGRLYLTSSSLCFLSTMLGREVRRLVDVKEITSMHKTQVASIKGAAISINTTSSAASGAAALQLCSFANRNRAFASLQRHLTASLPHLAARWQTPSSATLQRQFGLPASELPLHEFPCSCDGPERSHRGTLCTDDEPALLRLDERLARVARGVRRRAEAPRRRRQRRGARAAALDAEF